MERNSISSSLNLCKIFEMRIKLDKEKGTKTPLDVLDNYEKYSKKIDSAYNSEFQKELKPLISPAVTLEKEEDRIKRLIRLLEDRLDKRSELEERYFEATGKYMVGLQMIVSESELDEKRERLSLISKYLETNKEIYDVKENINKLNDLLEEEVNKKFDYESKNKIMEDELYSSIMSILKEDEYFRNISEEDINSELDIIRSKVAETKETLDITRDSVGSLISSGLEDDYSSYVEEAERSYYVYKNREIVLKIYKLVIDFENDFKLICAKREKISDLLDELKSLKEDLTINTSDDLISFEKVLLVQRNILDTEREVLENIANYESRISFKEERLEELNEVVNSVEILSILREYGLVETYDTEDTLEEIEGVSFEEEVILDNPSVEVVSNVVEIPEIKEEVISYQEYNPYRIVDVREYPRTLNVGLAKLKGESVREKVNKKLNPKVEESAFENIISNVVDVPSVSEESIDTSIPVIEEVVDNGIVNVSPVWEIPSNVEATPVAIEEAAPVLPVWEAVEPVMEAVKPINEIPDVGNFDISSTPIFDNDINMNAEANNLFWTPVSESNMETNAFPNLNIPVNNNFGGNGSFEFPSLNN